jgi:hypothetical protein
MRITEKQIRRIIRKELLREQTGGAVETPTSIVNSWGTEMSVEIGTIADVEKMIRQIPRKGYKPDQHSVYTSKNPGLPPQEQADKFFASLTPGMPGGPEQFYWDPQTETLFAHMVLNTF